MAKRPTGLTIRAYQVGFGDCFLLSWRYSDRNRHVLIDFGTKGTPKSAPKNLMKLVAEDIKRTSNGKLDAVVLTHRHQDHISGFSTTKKGTGTGDVIRSLKPDVVVQPWTEDPNAAPGALEAKKTLVGPKGFVASLAGMQKTAAGIAAEAALLQASEPKGLRRQQSFATLAFLGEAGIKNDSAVRNLQKMGKRHAYVSHGSDSGLENVLPGVRITVLGPPTLKQSDAIRNERHEDAAEFWMLKGLAGEHVATARGRGLFPRYPQFNSSNPPEWARWFIPRVRSVRKGVLLSVVRVLDKAMNNTSVILLFEVGKQSFLFPGDAQIENWEYTLKKPSLLKRLRRVTFYKVGHHGSRNATPLTLWKAFKNKSKKKGSGRMAAVMSTMANMYGKSEETKVPRTTLVDALETHTDFFSTQDIKGKTKISKDFTFTF